jgi:hypothetical protein
LNIISYEARCTVDGETFIPADEEDLIHLVREDGTECGEQGILLGAWGTQEKEQA